MGREGHGDSGRAGQLWRAAQRLPSACPQQGTLKTPGSPCSRLPSLVLIQSWSLGVALSTAYPVCFFLSLLVLNLNVALSLWAWTASCQAAWWSGWDNDPLIPAPMLSPKYTHFLVSLEPGPTTAASRNGAVLSQPLSICPLLPSVPLEGAVPAFIYHPYLIRQQALAILSFILAPPTTTHNGVGDLPLIPLHRVNC